MGDGRTPTITITGAASEGTVTFVDERSVWPFTGIRTRRRRQDRETRDAAEDEPGRTIRVWRRFNHSEQELPFQATLNATDLQILIAIAEADPPACEVHYLSGGGVDITWDVASLGDFDWDPAVGLDQDSDGPSEYEVSGTLLRGSPAPGP